MLLICCSWFSSTQAFSIKSNVGHRSEARLVCTLWRMTSTARLLVSNTYRKSGRNITKALNTKKFAFEKKIKLSHPKIADGSLNTLSEFFQALEMATGSRASMFKALCLVHFSKKQLVSLSTFIQTGPSMCCEWSVSAEFYSRHV